MTAMLGTNKERSIKSLLDALLARDSALRIEPQGDGTHKVLSEQFPDGLVVTDSHGVLGLDEYPMRDKFQGPDVVEELIRFAENFCEAADYWVARFPDGSDGRLQFEKMVKTLHTGLMQGIEQEEWQARGSTRARVIESDNHPDNIGFHANFKAAAALRNDFMMAIDSAARSYLGQHFKKGYKFIKRIGKAGEELRSLRKPAVLNVWQDDETKRQFFRLYESKGHYTDAQLRAKQANNEVLNSDDPRRHATTAHQRHHWQGTPNFHQETMGTLSVRRGENLSLISATVLSRDYNHGALTPYENYKGADTTENRLHTLTTAIRNEEEVLVQMAANEVGVSQSEHTVRRSYMQLVSPGLGSRFGHEYEQFRDARAAGRFMDGQQVRLEDGRLVTVNENMMCLGMNMFRNRTASRGFLKGIPPEQRLQNIRGFNQLLDDFHMMLQRTDKFTESQKLFLKRIYDPDGKFTQKDQALNAQHAKTIVEKMHFKAQLYNFDEWMTLRKNASKLSPEQSRRLEELSDSLDGEFREVSYYEAKLAEFEGREKQYDKAYSKLHKARVNAWKTNQVELRQVIRQVLASDSGELESEQVSLHNTMLRVHEMQEMFYAKRGSQASWTAGKHLGLMQQNFVIVAADLGRHVSYGCKSNNDRGQTIANSKIAARIADMDASQKGDGVYLGKSSKQYDNAWNEKYNDVIRYGNTGAVAHRYDSGVTGCKFGMGPGQSVRARDHNYKPLAKLTYWSRTKIAWSVKAKRFWSGVMAKFRGQPVNPEPVVNDYRPEPELETETETEAKTEIKTVPEIEKPFRSESPELSDSYSTDSNETALPPSQLQHIIAAQAAERGYRHQRRRVTTALKKEMIDDRPDDGITLDR